MKAVYKKPVLRLEYFTLSQSIASCGDFSDSTLGEPGNHQDRTCGWDMGKRIWGFEENGSLRLQKRNGVIYELFP